MFLVQRLYHNTRGIVECRIFSPEIEHILAQWKAREMAKLKTTRASAPRAAESLHRAFRRMLQRL